MNNKNRVILIMLANLLFGSILYAQSKTKLPFTKIIHNEVIEIDSLQRNHFLDSICTSMSAYLNADNYTLSMPNVIDIPDLQKTAYTIKQGSYLSIGSDSIYFRLISIHERRDIGDLTIAYIKSTNQCYWNEGHICGGIIHFDIDNVKPVNHIHSFFDTSYCDVDKSKWIPLHFIKK